MAGNAAVDFSEMLKNLAPLFLGSGKTTTEEGSPVGSANIQQLLATIMPQITGTEQTDAVVQNIMTKAAQTFMPVNFAANNASGLYGSTTGKLLQNDFMARATGEAAQAVLSHQTDMAKTAASLAQASVGANRKITQQTAPTINPLISGLGAAAMIGRSVPGGKKPGYNPQQKPAPVVTGKPSWRRGEEEASAEGVNGNVGGVGLGTGAASFADSAAGGEAFNYSTDMAQFIGDNSAGVDENFLQSLTMDSRGVGLLDKSFFPTYSSDIAGGAFDAAGDAIDTSAWPDVTDELDFSSDFGSEGLSEVGGAIGDAADLGFGEVAPFIGPAIDVINGDWGEGVGGAVGSYFGGPIGGFVGSKVGGFLDGSFICTELCRQGVISQLERGRATVTVYRQISATTIAGYHIWGSKFAQLMRKSPLLTKLGHASFKAWIDYVRGKSSFYGAFLNYTVRPLTYLLGLFASSTAAKQKVTEVKVSI